MVDRPARQQRAERDLVAVGGVAGRAAPPGAEASGAKSADAAANRCADSRRRRRRTESCGRWRARSGRGRARCRCSAASCSTAAEALSGGSLITSDGRTWRASVGTPRAWRWAPVISAPESVVGIARHRPRNRVGGAGSARSRRRSGRRRRRPPRAPSRRRSRGRRRARSAACRRGRDRPPPAGRRRPRRPCRPGTSTTRAARSATSGAAASARERAQQRQPIAEQLQPVLQHAAPEQQRAPGLVMPERLGAAHRGDPAAAGAPGTRHRGASTGSVSATQRTAAGTCAGSMWWAASDSWYSTGRPPASSSAVRAAGERDVHHLVVAAVRDEGARARLGAAGDVRLPAVDRRHEAGEGEDAGGRRAVGRRGPSCSSSPSPSRSRRRSSATARSRSAPTARRGRRRASRARRRTSPGPGSRRAARRTSGSRASPGASAARAA